MFLIPPIASVVLFLQLWWRDLLPRPYLTGGWVLLGVLTQWIAPGLSGFWVAGLLLNVGTAIYMAIRLKLSS
jgi:hypothetical protein